MPEEYRGTYESTGKITNITKADRQGDQAFVNLPRSRLVQSYWHRILRRYLMRLAQSHLRRGAPQVATFSLAIVGVTIALEGQYERDELAFLHTWLANEYGERLKQGTAIDMGANIGNHSVALATIFNKVYSFEPNPEAYRLLESNTASLKNITCLNLGVSSGPRTFELAIPRLNVRSASIQINDGHPSGVDTIVVSCDSLDRLGLDMQDLLLIKVDVEGHELAALFGAQETIKVHMPTILFEQSADDIVNGSSAVIDLLRELGYDRFSVIEKIPRYGSPRSSGILSRALKLVFGQKLVCSPREVFKPVYHPLIVAQQLGSKSLQNRCPTTRRNL